jgi:hypothetical protein
MLVILAPTAAIFGWAIVQMHRETRETAAPAAAQVDARPTT